MTITKFNSQWVIRQRIQKTGAVHQFSTLYSIRGLVMEEIDIPAFLHLFFQIFPLRILVAKNEKSVFDEKN